MGKLLEVRKFCKILRRFGKPCTVALYVEEALASEPNEETYCSDPKKQCLYMAKAVAPVEAIEDDFSLSCNPHIIKKAYHPVAEEFFVQRFSLGCDLKECDIDIIEFYCYNGRTWNWFWDSAAIPCIIPSIPISEPEKIVLGSARCVPKNAIIKILSPCLPKDTIGGIVYAKIYLGYFILGLLLPGGQEFISF